MWTEVRKIQIVIAVAVLALVFAAPFIYKTRVGRQELQSQVAPQPPAEASQSAIKRGLATTMSASVAQEVRTVTVKPDASVDVESVVKDVLNAASPEDGIAQVLVQLQKQASENVAKASVLYHAMGILYLRAEPPDIAQADAAFRDAASTADTAELRQELALASARAWLEQDEKVRARKIVTDSLQQDKNITAAYLRLWLLMGSLEEMDAKTESAEQAYAYVVDSFPDVCPELGKHCEDVYRRACQMLYSLYDRTNRRGEAEMLHTTMRETLVKLESPSALPPTTEGESRHEPPALSGGEQK